jgi:hypothetical protein
MQHHDRGLAIAAGPWGYGVRKMMGARAKQRGDHGKLTYVVSALGKTVVWAGGNGFSLEAKADGDGAPRQPSGSDEGWNRGGAAWRSFSGSWLGARGCELEW